MTFVAGEQAGRPGANRGERYPAEPLTQEDGVALLSTLSRRAPTSVRNRVVILLMHRCGLRISEVLGMHVKDVRVSVGKATVTGKGDKSRWVGVPDDVMYWLVKWLECCEEQGIGVKAPLACTLRGAPVSGQYVRTMLHRKAKQAGLDRRVNPHALRHTFAMGLLREGASMPAIQKALGHASLAGTGVYLAHLDDEDVVNLMRSR